MQPNSYDGWLSLARFISALMSFPIFAEQAIDRELYSTASAPFTACELWSTTTLVALSELRPHFYRFIVLALLLSSPSKSLSEDSVTDKKKSFVQIVTADEFKVAQSVLTDAWTNARQSKQHGPMIDALTSEFGQAPPKRWQASLAHKLSGLPLQAG